MPHAQVNGQELFYVDSDPAGDKPPVVLMHGFLMDHRMFDPLLPALADRYRVIRIDARGFGQTPWDGRPFTLYDGAADCMALMDHLGVTRAVLGGMSRGGYLALRAALLHPERARGLLLMSTRVGVDPPEVRAIYEQVAALWGTAEAGEAIIQRNADAIIGPESEVGAERAEWLPRWRLYDPKAIAAGIRAMVEQDDLTDRLGELEMPALVVHGDADVGIPISYGEALVSGLPDARGLVRVPGAHHAAVMTHAEVVKSPIRAFIDAVYD